MVALAALQFLPLRAAPAGAPYPVVVVLSDDALPYREFARALRIVLPEPAFQIRTVAWQERAAWSGMDAGAMVAVGVRAAQATLARPASLPLLCALLPRAAFESLLEGAPGTGRQVSAVFLDQPMRRHVQLIRGAFPDARRVGVLLGRDSAPLSAELAAAASAAGLTLAAERVEMPENVLDALRRVLQAADLLLALPDPGIYSSESLRPILLTSFRMRRPVVGFSEGYVRAGAVVAVHSSPAQIALQAGEAISRLRDDGRMPAPEAPRYYSVSVNSHVARSLETTIPRESELEALLASGEPK